jgi:hypothetical protein
MLHALCQNALTIGEWIALVPFAASCLHIAFAGVRWLRLPGPIKRFTYHVDSDRLLATDESGWSVVIPKAGIRSAIVRGGLLVLRMPDRRPGYILLKAFEPDDRHRVVAWAQRR